MKNYLHEKSATTKINYFRLNEKNWFRSIKSLSHLLVYMLAAAISTETKTIQLRAVLGRLRKRKGIKNFFLISHESESRNILLLLKTQIHISEKKVMASSAYCYINNIRPSRKKINGGKRSRAYKSKWGEKHNFIDNRAFLFLVISDNEWQ